MADGNVVALRPAAQADPSMARCHLEKVGIYPETRLVFQTVDDVRLPDGRKRNDRSLLQTLFGTFEEVLPRLLTLNARGAGIFFLFNCCDGSGGRKGYNIKASGGLFHDDDIGRRADSFPLPCSFAIETSPGRFQRYWICDPDNPITLDEFDGSMRRLVQEYGADPQSADRARVLRLAGFVHMKGEPWLVRPTGEGTMGRSEEWTPYSRTALLEAFPPIPLARRVEGAGCTKASDYPNAEAIAAIAEMLVFVPCEDRSDWLDVGMILHHTFWGDEEGFDLFCRWSGGDTDRGGAFRGSSKYDERDQRYTWDHFHCDHRNPRALGSLIWKARQGGWQGRMPGDAGAFSAIAEAPAPVAEWPAPDMSALHVKRSPPPRFPVEVFGRAAEFLTEAAATKGAPVDYVCGGLLASCAALVGNGVQVVARAGWVEQAILWTALVGAPSTNKTPALNVSLAALARVEADLAEGLPELLREHEARAVAAAELRKQWQAAVKEAALSGAAVPPLPASAEEPEAPIRPQIKIQEATQEAVAELAAKQPRGLLVCRDEISGWIGSMDRFAAQKGADRGFYLEGYNGNPYDVRRKSKGASLHIRRLSVSITGGIQPDKMDELLLKGADDGLSARFLYFYPDPAPFARHVTEVSSAPLDRAFSRLASLAPRQQGEPRDVLLDDAAQKVFLDWAERHTSQAQTQTGIFGSALGKMQGQALRLALVLACLRWAWESDDFQPPPMSISVEVMRAAILLVDKYFQPTLLRVLGEAGINARERTAVVLARAILARECKELNKRDVQRNWNLQGLRSAEALDGAVRELIEAGWLVPKAQSGGRGRPAGDYIVNPRVFDGE